MGKSKIAQFISIIFKVMLVLGTISLFFIPKIYDAFSGIDISFGNQSIYYQIAFYLCAIGSLIVVYELTKIFNDVYKGSPFKKSIEISLKRIAVLFMILFIIVAVKIIFIPTVVSAAIALVLFIASLSFYVLSQVFKVAIEYKAEIDYTV